MKTFYVGIKGVIIKDDKVLILRSSTKNGRRDMWEIPGGRIDDDETIEQALRRELQEELPNISNVDVHEILHAYRLLWEIDGDKGLTLIFYRVSADFDGEPKISEEHVAYKWATKDEALKLVQDSTKPAVSAAFNEE
jgi:8-oxo-dGTP diphosphatase